MLKVSLNNTKTEQLYWVSFNKRSELNRDSSLQLSLVIDGDSPHCICRDLTEIAPCFELVLLQTVDLFRDEEIAWFNGKNCGKTVPIFHKETEVGDRLTAELE